MQKNSQKPILVPTAYSARTVLWSLALVLLFGALLWDYGAWSALEKARAIDPGVKPEDLRQDEDVLDTWFSSWLWPF